MDRQTERQRSPDEHTPKVLTGVEVVGLVASVATLLDYSIKILSDNDSKKSNSRRNRVNLLKCRLENTGKAYENSDSLITGELPDAVRTCLKELKEIASNLQKRVSSGVIKAIKCRVVQGSFDTQIESLRKGLEDIEGALKPYSPSSGYASANALMSHHSNGHVQAPTSTSTPHVQNNFYIKNLTVNIPTNDQAPEYKYPETLYAAAHAQIAQPLKYNNAPGTPYLAPQAPIGYPHY